MSDRRATAIVAVVVVIAIAQIGLEDVIVFLGATGTGGPSVLSSPLAFVVVPFVLFCLLVGVVFAWALTGEQPRQ